MTSRWWRRCLRTGLGVVAVVSLGSRPAPAATLLPELLVEARTAKRLKISPGDSLELSRDGAFSAPRTFRVGGLYAPPANPTEIGRAPSHIRLHLPDLEALTGERDQATRIALKLAPGASADDVAREIGQMHLGVAAYNSVRAATQSTETFHVIERFHFAIGLVTLAAGAVFLLAIMVLQVDENRREFGTLRLIGIRRGTLALAVALSAAIVAVAGCVIGLGFAALASVVVNHVYQAKYQTDLVFARVDGHDVLVTCGLSLALGLMAACAALWRLVRSNVLELFER